MGDRRCAYRVSKGKYEGNDQLGKHTRMRNGMIKLKWICGKKDLRKWIGLTWLTIRRGGGVFL